MVSVFINTCCTKHWIGKCAPDMISNSLWQQGPRKPERLLIGRKANLRGIIWNVCWSSCWHFVHFSLDVDLACDHMFQEARLLPKTINHNPQIDAKNWKPKKPSLLDPNIKLPSTGGPCSNTTTILILMQSVVVLFESKNKFEHTEFPSTVCCLVWKQKLIWTYWVYCWSLQQRNLQHEHLDSLHSDKTERASGEY